MGFIFDKKTGIWKLENGGRMIPKFLKAGILKKIYYWRSPDYSGLSFNDAFTAARHFKDEDFWWNGNIYNTKLAPSTVSPTLKMAGVNNDKPYIPSLDIKNYIKSTEKFEPNWYRDGNGYLTIGYGFKKSAHPKLWEQYQNGMTKALADEYFETVIADSLARFLLLTPNFDKLNLNLRDALLSYYYNIGEGGYSSKSPAMQKALRELNWKEVANQMDFGYNDTKNPGLKKRRDYERNLFLTPIQ